MTAKTKTTEPPATDAPGAAVVGQTCYQCKRAFTLEDAVQFDELVAGNHRVLAGKAARDLDAARPEGTPSAIERAPRHECCQPPPAPAVGAAVAEVES